MWILSAIIAIIGAIAGVAGVAANVESVKDTNKTNLDLTRETNAANVEQAELAYRRSLPINQVQNLVDAGMSKQGALASLTGGGSYTAPTLQAGHADAPQMDLNSMSAAFERLNNIPSNVEQNQLVHTQRKALEQEIINKNNQDRRDQEKHEFDMWRYKYDKNTALMLDSASTKVANALLDSGKTMQDFKDFEHMLRELGLDKDTDIRNINYIARQQLEQGVRDKFSAELVRQAQDNANREQDNRDKRTNEDVATSRQSRQLAREEQTNRNRRTNEDIKTSKHNRQLSREEQTNRNQQQKNNNRQQQNLNEETLIHKNQNRYDRELKRLTIQQLRENYNESVAQHNFNEKERTVREAQLRVEQLLAERNISQQEFLNDIHMNKDGSISFYGRFNYAHNSVFNDIVKDYGTDLSREVFNTMINTRLR